MTRPAPLAALLATAVVGLTWASWRPALAALGAKHAVLEAAILATRLHLLPRDEVAAEYRKLRVIVDKTGGPDEFAAMSFLEDHFARHGGSNG